MERSTLKLWGGLVALLGAGAAVLWPHWTQVRDLRDERSALGRRAALSDDGAAAVRRLEAELQTVQARAVSFVTPIPSDSDVASLIRQLSGMLDGLGISEREITTGAAVKDEDVSSMPMSVRIAGEFGSVYAAVRWIEGLPRLVRVQRVKIEADRPGAKADVRKTAGRVKAELLIDVFFAPRTPDKTPGSVKPAQKSKAGGKP